MSDELCKELLRQWAINHERQCGKEIDYAKPPHSGICYWELPLILTAQYSIDEIGRLLTEADA